MTFAETFVPRIAPDSIVFFASPNPPPRTNFDSFLHDLCAVLSRYGGDYFVLVEQSKRGKVHVHLLVVTGDPTRFCREYRRWLD
ncbi:MAG TPA: hypothetical protein VG963_18710, partial [Polyangiaceae bacterium]|nr:hypothetical protein [Polyangiaceae bacterium]